MPDPQYWISPPSLYSAGAFALFAILGFVGIANMTTTYRGLLISGYIFALILFFIGWLASARQEKQNADTQNILRLIQTAVMQNPVIAKPTKIAKVENNVSSGTASAVENLSRLSNTQLRNKVSDLTARMRTFEGGVKASQAELLNNVLPPNATDAQRTAAFNEQTKKTLQQFTEAQNEFRKSYLPEALALRDEMSRREGILKPYPFDSKNIALDFGMMAGVTPISDAANFLESLARQLPQ